MNRYAQGTAVSTMRSLEQIKRLLAEAKATEVATAEGMGKAMISFVLADRRIKFTLTMPALSAFAQHVVRGRRQNRTPAQALMAWEQAHREQWRALYATIKAKLISAASGIETLEQAFLANVVTSTGETVWQHVSTNKGFLTPPALPAGDIQ